MVQQTRQLASQPPWRQQKRMRHTFAFDSIEKQQLFLPVVELNDDCWRHVISFLSNDHDALFKLALANKSLFQLAVAELYRSPLIQFRNLSRTAKAMLEDLLLYQRCLNPLSLNHSLKGSSAFVSAALDATKLQHQQPTIDYISLVQEMPDSPSHESFCYNDGSDSGILLYRYMFGSKIKMACLSTSEGDLLEKSIGLLSGLQDLTVEACDNVGCAESMYKVVPTTLTTHRAMYPGVLQKATFRIFDYIRGSCRSDVKMMMTIRDALGGDRWCTEELILEIPSDMDPYVQKLLQDVDLPKVLKSIKIWYTESTLEEHWVSPLRLFLSRCKQLDSITFHGFLPPVLLDWALEHSPGRESLTGEYDRAQWRSMEFNYDHQNKTDYPTSREMAGLEQLWQIVIFGFGHCVESLVFKAAVCQPEWMGFFRKLSLPETIHLPKLRSLHLRYPSFERLAYSGVDRLQQLIFEIDYWLQTDKKWDDWKLWSSVEELHVRIGSTDYGVDIFKSLESLSFCLPDKQNSSCCILTSPYLSRLKSVTISNTTAAKLNPNILLIGSNIANLILVNPNTNVMVDPENLSTHRFMDWSWFLEKSTSRSLLFPNLKCLEAGEPLHLRSANFTRQFLRLPSFANNHARGKTQLFPSIGELKLGPIVNPMRIRDDEESGCLEQDFLDLIENNFHQYQHQDQTHPRHQMDDDDNDDHSKRIFRYRCLSRRGFDCWNSVLERNVSHHVRMTNTNGTITLQWPEVLFGGQRWEFLLSHQR